MYEKVTKVHWLSFFIVTILSNLKMSRQLSEFHKAQILAKLDEGWTVRRVAAHYGRDKQS